MALQDWKKKTGIANGISYTRFDHKFSDERIQVFNAFKDWAFMVGTDFENANNYGKMFMVKKVKGVWRVDN